MCISWKLAFIVCLFGLSSASKLDEKLDEEGEDLGNTVDEDTAHLEPSVSSNLYSALNQINELRHKAQTTRLSESKTIHRPNNKPHLPDTLPGQNDVSDVSKIVPSPTARMVIGQHEEVVQLHFREKRGLQKSSKPSSGNSTGVSQSTKNSTKGQNNKPVLFTLISPNGSTTVYSTGSYTLPGAMHTEVKNGYPYTYSTYTRIIDAVPTVGVITLAPLHTYYAGQLVPHVHNVSGVPSVGNITLGTYTLPGAMHTEMKNGYPYTYSTYTRIIDAVPTVGVITLAPLHTYYAGQLVPHVENVSGVPSVGNITLGTYTLPGAMHTEMKNGYPYTYSTYTKIIDAVPTVGVITLAPLHTYDAGQLVPHVQNVSGVPSLGDINLSDLQTYFHDKIVPPGQNPYGIPNQGTFTFAGGNARTVMISGHPATVSTYTKIVHGVPTYGTITLGSMRTASNGSAVRPGQKSSFFDENGYPVTVVTSTKVAKGSTTFETLTKLPQTTRYDGHILRYGEDILGGSSKGHTVLPGRVSFVDIDGQMQTRSTLTKIADGQMTYVTLTVFPMQENLEVSSKTA